LAGGFPSKVGDVFHGTFKKMGYISSIKVIMFISLYEI
jgi:hypothetical protein